MKSKQNGKNISDVEIQNISTHGIWLYVKGSEYFLPYNEFPWFRDAKISEIFNVDLIQEKYLHWPILDVDLEIDSIKNPNNYPLFYKS